MTEERKIMLVDDEQTLPFYVVEETKLNGVNYLLVTEGDEDEDGDEDDSLRAEYSRMLQDQLERGNNGLIKSKHITFGIEADGYKTAKPRLERLETDILNNFRKLGVKAEPLDGW